AFYLRGGFPPVLPDSEKLTVPAALQKIGIDAETFLAVLSSVDLIRGIRTRVASPKGPSAMSSPGASTSKHQACQLSEEILKVVELLELDVQHLGRGLIYRPPKNFRITPATSFEDLPLQEPLATEKVAHNLAVFAMHLYEGLLSQLVAAVNKKLKPDPGKAVARHTVSLYDPLSSGKDTNLAGVPIGLTTSGDRPQPASAYEPADVEKLMQNYACDKLQNWFLPQHLEGPVEETKGLFAEALHASDVVSYENGTRTV
ncbi:unnamed protein product, partial [Amoebophrya sp. A120]